MLRAIYSAAAKYIVSAKPIYRVSTYRAEGISRAVRRRRNTPEDALSCESARYIGSRRCDMFHTIYRLPLANDTICSLRERDF